MRLKIRTYPDRVLRQCGQPVAVIDDRIRDLVRDMIETMNADEGLGLAAPQVGESLRMFILRDQEDPDRVYAVINPTLELAGGSVLDEEGCLSVPGKRAEVRRRQIPPDGYAGFRKAMDAARDWTGQTFRIAKEGK